jgi:hypothetical protein
MSHAKLDNNLESLCVIEELETPGRNTATNISKEVVT